MSGGSLTLNWYALGNLLDERRSDRALDPMLMGPGVFAVHFPKEYFGRSALYIGQSKPLSKGMLAHAANWMAGLEHIWDRHKLATLGSAEVHGDGRIDDLMKMPIASPLDFAARHREAMKEMRDVEWFAAPFEDPSVPAHNQPTAEVIWDVERALIDAHAQMRRGHPGAFLPLQNRRGTLKKGFSFILSNRAAGDSIRESEDLISLFGKQIHWQDSKAKVL